MARISLFAPILVLLLFVITCSTLVPNHPEKGHHEVGESTDLDHNTFLRNSTEIFKRSYGVPTIGGGIIPGVILAYPWPVTCPGKQWVRYCFKDQRSMEMLLTPLTAAILNWVPAMEGTAFKIQPESACEGNYACLCSHVGRNGQTVNTDALVIRVIWPRSS